MLSFHKVVQKDFEAVNQTIIEQLHSDVGLVENIGHYIVDAGGKRLRPLLVLLLAKTFGYQGSQHIALAAIIEFIHTATLLHDDVVDLSSLRRGRATANAKWGNAPSVLVGDFLYSRSFQMMVAIHNMEIMAILSDTTNVISEGEVQQLVNAKDPNVDEANYMNVIHKKTAALFEAACEVGSVIAECNAQQREASRKFGLYIGMAFQLIDDALDYQGEAEALGKNVGDDLAEGKPTLPLIYAIGASDETDAQLIKRAITEGGLDKLDDILRIVNNCGALDYVKQRAVEQANLAKETIKDFPDNPFKSALLELADFSVQRSF